jgi:hypothetical protein
VHILSVLKQKLAKPDITKLILESDWHVTKITLEKEATHSGLSTHYQPSVYVGHRFIGGPIGL